jgi:hypothetical protein
MDDQSLPAPKPPNSAYVAIRIILGIIFLLPGACGSLFFGAAVVEWVGNSFAFNSGAENFTPVAAFIGAGSIMLSVVLIGILLRFAVWRHAPMASLVMAIGSAILIVLNHRMLATPIADASGDTIFQETGASLLALVVVSLPPFLHWWKSRGKTGEPVNEDKTGRGS